MLKTVEGKNKNIHRWIVEHSLSGISKEIQSEDNYDQNKCINVLSQYNMHNSSDLM